MALTPYRDLQSPLEVARSFVAAGQLRKARSVYKQALKASPRRPEVLSELGSVEAQCGNVAAARQLMHKAIELSPGIAAFHYNLGELERQADRHDAAEASFRKALAISPDDPDALFGLGCSLLLQGRPAEALDSLSRAHALSLRDVEILNEMGNALCALGRNDDALESYRLALRIRPDYLDCWLNLALCCFDLDRFGEASQAFDRAAALGPIPPAMLWKRGHVQAQCGLYDAAVATADACIEADPHVAQAWFVKGMVAQYHGDFEQAERHFRRTLQLAPGSGEAYEKLALIRRLDSADAPAVEAILSGGENVADITRAAAGFTLYRLYDAAGDTANAFRALAEANRIRRAADPFDGPGHVAELRAIADVFTSSFFARHAGEGVAGDAPIFILGMPRSGTTLVEQILAGTPGVFAGGEQMAVQALVRTLPGYPGSLRDKDAAWARAQGKTLLDRLTARSAGARHVTDKTPSNYIHVGLVAWLLPEAKIICCHRDGMDVGFSCFEQNFHKGVNYSYDLDDFALAWRAHEEIVAHWESVLPGRMYHLDYEKLARDPAPEAKKMVEFCGLQWNDACLDTTRVDRPIQTASFWQARQPIGVSSIGKWRRYEEHLSPLAKALVSP